MAPKGPMIAQAIKENPMTVKEIAAATGISESFTRELLKSIVGVVADDSKPARYHIPAPPPAPEPEPTLENWEDPKPEEAPEEPEVDEAEKQATKTKGCPFCPAMEGTQAPAGPAGTFLGDAVLKCGECGKAYGKFTRLEMPLKTGKGKGTRRALLNPQYKINAKIAAATEAGGTLTFSKVDRIWRLTTPKNPDGIPFTATQFSVETPETIAAYFKA